MLQHIDELLYRHDRERNLTVAIEYKKYQLNIQIKFFFHIFHIFHCI